MPSYKLIFTPEVKIDVKTATSYYNCILKGLGKRFKNEVKLQLILLKENPFIHSYRYDEVRLAIIPHFPYSIHYTINDMQITIHAIICDYRSPVEYWERIQTFSVFFIFTSVAIPILFGAIHCTKLFTI